MFTMQQVRNMFFALLNQSMQNDRAITAESRLDKIDTECVRLDETDKALEKDMNDKNKALSDRLSKFKEDSSQLQRFNEKSLNEHRLKLAAGHETATRHKEQLDEQKRFLTTNTEKISQVGARVDKTKEFLEKDINETREEIYAKIE